MPPSVGLPILEYFLIADTTDRKTVVPVVVVLVHVRVAVVQVPVPRVATIYR